MWNNEAGMHEVIQINSDRHSRLQRLTYRNLDVETDTATQRTVGKLIKGILNSHAVYY